MDRAALHRASPNPPRGVSAARQGLNKVPSGHEYKSSARPKADRRHEKLNTMTTSQVSGSGPHTYNVSGLDRTNWKPDPRNAGRSSGRNDKSGSWHAQSDLPTTRESVDDMSDDDFKDMMKRYVTENFGSMVNKYVENFGSIKNCHSNKGKAQIKPEVRISRRKQTMAACLCRHMKEELFSETTVTMAEKDRKSYFDKTRRLLGKCGYAQNLALFYVLYVRKKVNGTAESPSTHCPPHNACVTKTNTKNILLFGAGDDHHNHHHLPHHLYGHTVYTPDTDHSRHYHHRTNTNANTFKKTGDSEQSKVRLKKLKPTVDETLTEDLFITHTHTHNMRTIKIEENGQIEHNASMCKEEHELKGPVAAPERRLDPGAFRFTLPATAPVLAAAKQTHQNHHNHTATCILVNERPPCTVSKHIKISTANSPHKSSKEEMRKLLVRRKHKIKLVTVRNKLARAMRRAADLVRIEEQMSKLGHLRRRRRRKSRRARRREIKGATSKMLHRDPCGNLAKAENSGNLTNIDNSEGCLPPTGRSWTRPGWYLGAASLHPAPRGRRAGRPAGPGLPNGDETGDDD